MNKNKKIIIRKIKSLKKFPYGNVRINCNLRSVKYYLYLMTEECVQSKHIIHLLARWRKKHEYWFQVQFRVSDEGTKTWLQHKVIDQPDRILFMIVANGLNIGHCGFFRFDFEKLSCEIDNIVRGNHHYPGIIEESLRNLMSWGRKELGLSSYTLETTSDNSKAIKLYHRLGFTEYKRIPMIYNKNENDFGEWVSAPEKFNGKIQRYNVFMKLAY